MNKIDTTKIVDLDLALDHINRLQDALMQCEECLSDITRAAEISTASGQIQLMRSFIESANKLLENRIQYHTEESSSSSDNITIIYS